VGRVWATRAVTLPAAGAAAGTVALASLTPLPTLGAAAVAGGAALYGAHKIHPWSERIGHSRKSLDAAKIAGGDTSIVIEIDDLPETSFGAYAFGRTVPGYEQVVWDPLRLGPPHALIAGTSGSGKSEMGASLIVPTAKKHGLHVVILDKKQGLDYQDLLEPDDEVHSTVEAWRSALQGLLDKATERAEIMLATRVRVRNPKTGNWHLKTPQKWWELPDHLRAEMPPILAVIDEAASPARDKKCLALIEQIGAETRAIGLSLVLLTQMPYATLFGGLIKWNLGVRVLLGPTDPTGRAVVLGGGIDAAAVAKGITGASAAVAEMRNRPAGVGEIAGLAAMPGTHRFRSYLFDRTGSLPRDVGLGTVEELDALEGMPFHRPGPAAPSAAQVPSDAPSGSSADAVLGEAPWNDTPLGVSPDTAQPSSAEVRPSVPERHRRFGPGARVRLRLGALQLLAGPRTPLADDRPPAFRFAVRKRCGLTCRACGTNAPGDYEADHILPRWHFADDDERRDDAKTNGQILCALCHMAKTQGEMFVWHLRERTRRFFRLSPLRVNHKPPMVSGPRIWAFLLLSAFLLGWLDGSWWMWALGLTVFNTFVIAMISKRYRRLFGKQRGAGVNAISDWDMQQERSNAEGADKATTGIYYGVRKFANRARLWPLFVTCTYLLGAWWLTVAEHAPAVIGGAVGAL
jgi:hypothetical protein